MFRFSKSKHPNFIEIYHRIDDIFPKKKSKLEKFKTFITRKIFFKKRKKFNTKILFIVIFCFITIWTLLFFLNLINIFNTSLNAKSTLEQAISQVNLCNFKKGAILANQAKTDFNLLNKKLNRLNENFIIKHIPYINSNMNDLVYFSEIAYLTSSIINRGSLIGDKINKNVNNGIKNGFTEFSPSEKKNVLKLIYESRQELTGMKANLNLILLDFEQIKLKGVFSLFKDKFEDLRNRLASSIQKIKEGTDMSYIIPKLAGYPFDSYFLVIFQNSDELRPTGGFIGTYGILHMSNGEIESFNTYDIYNIDKPNQELLNIIPPKPIAEHLAKKWFMRDANWSPDWPTTAKKLQWFYNQENILLKDGNRINSFCGDFDGVIAINTKFVTELLGVVEPIEVNGKKFYQSNFIDLLQYEVEKQYLKDGKDKSERKEIIGDILKQLKIKFFNLPYSKLLTIQDKIKNSIEKKDVMLFFKDGYYENIAKKIGIGGEIKNTNFDYLMVVDSNMKAFKTDAEIRRKINYTLKQENNELFADVLINYTHSGKKSWKVSDYRSYTRIFVPEGSVLISESKENLGEMEDGRVDTGNIYGKTFFGTFFSLKSGQSGNLRFKYKLPYHTYDYSDYSLYIQKQSGVIADLNIDIDLINNIRLYKEENSNIQENVKNDVNIKTNLESDKLFKILQ